MNTQPSTWVWRLTALVALALIVATAALAVRAVAERQVGAQAYLGGPSLLINLHEAPGYFTRTVLAGEHGTPVMIRAVDRTDPETTWYLVELEQAQGWVDAHHLSADPP